MANPPDGDSDIGSGDPPVDELLPTHLSPTTAASELLESVRDGTLPELYLNLLADADASVGDTENLPVRFGILGKFSDFLGRMPVVVIVDRRDGEPVIAATHRGRSTFDRPDVGELLAELDELRSTYLSKLHRGQDWIRTDTALAVVESVTNTSLANDDVRTPITRPNRFVAISGTWQRFLVSDR